ncbi:MAG: hypothetical protein ABIA59_09035, partial [Candidatus Latescibacterota bacterium]
TSPRLLELLLTGLIASPILVGLSGSLAMVLGLSAHNTVITIAAVTAALGAAALIRNSKCDGLAEFSGRQLFALGATIIALCALVVYLPLTDEWWRMRSDGWFHGAVIAEIAEYGVPPQDPYFYGINLQYMWIYHVLVLLVSRAAHIDPFFVMPLFNIQALAALCLATFLLSFHFKKRFSYGFSSMLTVVLGLNALFWLFIPLKLFPAFVGETRGWSEVGRILSLAPLHIETVRQFTHFAHSQVFFLDKFIVATAFSLGLSFMAAAWYAVVSGLAHKRPFFYFLLFISSAGMIAFHAVAGFVIVAGFLAGLLMLLLLRRTIDRPQAKSCTGMILMLLASAAVLLPFLLLVTHGKDSEQLIPISITFGKLTSIVVSCALAIVLASFQAGRLLGDRSAGSRFAIAATLSILVICLLISLPVVNAYDKLPFFVFFPLAVAGGWTLAELGDSRWSFFRKRINRWIVFVVLFAPLTSLHMIGAFATPPREMLDTWEKAASSWVQQHTDRDAVFFDCLDRVFLIVPAPRRYYWGLEKYAKLWNYDKNEMARRRAARENLYAGEELNRQTLYVLGDIDAETYIIARDDPECAGGIAKLTRYPNLFTKVYESGPIHIFAVQRERCREAVE